MKSKLLVFIFMALISFSMFATEVRVGQCGVKKDSNSEIYDRFTFSVDSYNQMIIRGIILTQEYEEIEITRYEINLNEADRNDQNEEKIKIVERSIGKFISLNIDKKQKSGEFKYSETYLKCYPGNNEWCIFKIPAHTKSEIKFQNCSLVF